MANSNPIYVTGWKGNLVSDVEEVVSAQKETFWKVKIASNNTHSRSDRTAFPQVMFFNEAGRFAATLKKGDYIEITEAMLNLGELEDPWKNKDGNWVPQSSTLRVNPIRTDGGILVPIKVLSSKDSRGKPAESKQQELPVGDTLDDVVAKIIA